MLFTERALPVLTHLQISEGLRQLVSTEYQKEAIKTFDDRKLQQYTMWIKDSEGFPTCISQLRKKLQDLAAYYSEKD